MDSARTSIGTPQKQSLVSVAAALSATLLVILSPAVVQLSWGARLPFVVGSLLFLFIIWRVEGRDFLRLKRPIASGLLLLGVLAVSSVFQRGLGALVPDSLSLLLLFLGPIVLVAGAAWAAFGFVRTRALQYWLEGAGCYFMLLLNVGYIVQL